MLIVENLSIMQNEKQIINDATFEIKKNDYVIIMGNNGSGKSTLIKALVNKIDYKGQIKLNGKDIKEVDELTAKISVTPQYIEDYFFTNRVIDELRFPLENLGMSNSKIEKIVNKTIKINEIKLNLKQAPVELSGGEKQQLAIYLSLLTNPELLIYDETLSMLDFKHKKIFRKKLKALSKKETIIMVSHDAHDLENANKIINVENGTVKMYTKKEFEKAKKL